MKVLNSHDVNFVGNGVDPVGDVFYYDNRVFRKINENRREKVLSLINSEVFKRLIEKKYFVNTWVSDYTFEDGALVLEHEKIFIFPSGKWTFSMIKDCACFILELNSFLNLNNLMLLDGHQANFTFVENKPILFDFGSIIEFSDNNDNFYREFMFSFVLILLLYSQNETKLGKCMFGCHFSDNNSHLSKTILMKFISSSNMFLKFLAACYGMLPNTKIFYKPKREIERLFRRRFRRKLVTVSNIISDIKRINWNYDETMWGDYYNTVNLTSAVNNRFNSVINYIKEFCSSSDSVVDLAGNQGTVAFMINKNLPFIKRIVNMDYDEVAIDKSYIYI